MKDCTIIRTQKYILTWLHPKGLRWNRNKGAINEETIIDTNITAFNAAFRNDTTTFVLPLKHEYNICDDLGWSEDVAWFPWSSALDSPKIWKRK